MADGFNLTTIELDEGQKIPTNLNEFDGMFCMGGPMDTYMEKEFPWLVEEKKRIKEYINLILDKPVRIVIDSSTPFGFKSLAVEKKLQKTRALYLRTFLINQGISHNRISIKFDKKRNISKNWKNELTLIFIGS